MGWGGGRGRGGGWSLCAAVGRVEGELNGEGRDIFCWGPFGKQLIIKNDLK